MSTGRTARRQKLRQPSSRSEAAAGAGWNQWLHAATLLLAAACLLGLFSSEIADTDFWWHLKTGQYIAQHHALPAPDPFAYTSASAPAYAGEAQVRHFNLTHEWLSQVLMFVVQQVAGFPGIVVVRALLLAALCGLAGFLAARLASSFAAGIAASFAAASVVLSFAADRPGVVSFLGVAVFVMLMELRRGWWALPALALIWANCHGGFFLGWVVLLAYCAENLWRHFRGEADPESRRLWLVTACSIAVSGLNPNGFGVVSTLFAYRRSVLTTNLIEWQPPRLWGAPYGFDILLYGAAIALLLSWRKVRPAHWMLFLAFAGASLAAFRNIALIGFLAPVLIAAYFPLRAQLPRIPVWPLPILLVAGLAVELSADRFFQFHVAEWTVPDGAAQFLIDHQVTGPLFNTYDEGGYLIWKLWPQERVFIDGRSLSERVYRDYQQILFNAGSYADQVAGPREELLNRYGAQTVVMNTMDSVSGVLYPLALALGNPVSNEWQLVYDDAKSVVFVRHPSPGMPVLSNKLGRVLRHLDQECKAYIENSPEMPLCARTLAKYWMSNDVKDDARQMLRLYLSHAPDRDPQAEQMLKDLESGASPSGR